MKKKEIDANLVFKPGTVIKRKDGLIGYVESVCTCELCADRHFFEPNFKFVNNKEEIDYCETYLSNYDINNNTDFLNIIEQIGKYKMDEYELFLPEKIITVRNNSKSKIEFKEYFGKNGDDIYCYNITGVFSDSQKEYLINKLKDDIRKKYENDKLNDEFLELLREMRHIMK